MRSILLLFAFLTLFCFSVSSQQPLVTVYDPPVEYVGNFGDWGTDLVAFNTEPFGKVSGVRRATDTIYIAVPDTLGLTGGGLRILKTSNNGANWLQMITVSQTGVIPKTRMIRSGLDTVYCVFQAPAGNNVYILRVNLPFADPIRAIFTGGYRDFDAWASSTGGLYVFLDSLGTNNIPRNASTNGGITWSQRALVTSAGAHPFTIKSGTGDTAILMYYTTAASLIDTTTAALTSARYRESAPGTLSSIAFLTGFITAGTQRDQFGAVLHSGVAWIFYTSGAPGSRNIMFRSSTNGGTSFGAETPFATRPGVDEYWFDIQHYSLGSGGLDVIYYYDSTGGPSNTSDKILYTSATTGAPETFSIATQISEHAPQPSARGYIPFLVEYYNAGGDAGVLWVGLDGANRRLYFDRLNAVVGVNNQNGIPEIYSLSQNYPNPFNPSTKIDFAIPKNGFVTLKVYDILGQEVAQLLNKDFQAGSYTVDYNASMLPSGVYFYKIISGDFIDTKKMILVK